MGLNLIDDAWIPVHTVGGARRIRAWEIADAGVEWVDWGRGDLNLGCLELLIGLVLIADPPENETDWHARYKRPLSARLRERLEALSAHFELDGPGPRFMQDLEPFEANGRRAASPADMLFIDSPGAKTRRNNADISVRRDRYGDLPLDLAAMALYTLQAWAPSGGAGNRTALRRGGGPLVTLVQPVAAGAHRLWRLVWANVPFGVPLEPTRCAQALPWLGATRTSEDGTTVTPDTCHPAQALFGMPRRLRLVVEAERVVEVIQKKHGTRYQGWVHPLTPHFRTNARHGAAPGTDAPRHPELPQLAGSDPGPGHRAGAACGDGATDAGHGRGAGVRDPRRGLGDARHEGARLPHRHLPEPSDGRTGPRHGSGRWSRRRPSPQRGWRERWAPRTAAPPTPRRSRRHSCNAPRARSSRTHTPSHRQARHRSSRNGSRP